MTTFPSRRAIVHRARFRTRLLHLLAIVLAGGSLLGVLPPAGAQESSGRSVCASTRVAVQLSGRYQFEFSAFLAALEKGFYRDAGLDVSLREWSPGIDVAREVGDRNADFGTLDSSLIVDRANGRPVVAVAALLQHSAVALLLRRQAGVTSAADLAGKRVGTTRATETEVGAYLMASGVSSDRYRHFPDLTDAGRALRDDEVDAVGVFVGDEVVRELAGGGDYLLLSPRSAAIDPYGTLLLTSEGLLESQPALVQAFLAATLKGLDYALDHPQELVDLIVTKYNTQNKSREQLLFEARQLGDLARPADVAPGTMSIARWQHVVDIYAGQGRIKPATDLLGFVYDPGAGSLGPFVPWLLGGGLLGLLAVGWGVRRFLATKR